MGVRNKNMECMVGLIIIGIDFLSVSISILLNKVSNLLYIYGLQVHFIYMFIYLYTYFELILLIIVIIDIYILKNR